MLLRLWQVVLGWVLINLVALLFLEMLGYESIQQYSAVNRYMIEGSPLLLLLDAVFCVFFSREAIEFLITPMVTLCSFVSDRLPDYYQAYFPTMSAHRLLLNTINWVANLPVINLFNWFSDLSFLHPFIGVFNWYYVFSIGVLLVIDRWVCHVDLGLMEVWDSVNKDLSAYYARQKKHVVKPQKAKADYSETRVKDTEAKAMLLGLKEEIRTLEKQKQQAQKDGLTGLLTRNVFNSRYKVAFQRCDRVQSDFALVMMDIDNFKQLNDTYGHTFGDIVLKKVGQVITGVIDGGYNSKASAFRYGGEELAIVITDGDYTFAGQLAETIRQQVNELTFDEHPSVRVSVSVGFAQIAFSQTNGNGVKANEVLEIADQLLYEAKHTGKNKVCGKPL